MKVALTSKLVKLLLQSIDFNKELNISSKPSSQQAERQPASLNLFVCVYCFINQLSYFQNHIGCFHNELALKS